MKRGIKLEKKQITNNELQVTSYELQKNSKYK